MRALCTIAAVLCACGAPPAPMPGADGESCEMPFKLLVDRLEATTAGYRDDEGSDRSSCGGGGSPDLVVSFTAAGGSLLTLTVTPTTATFQPMVKVRSAAHGCVDLDDACDTAIGAGKPAEVKSWVPTLSGTHYVIIDGQSQTSGGFILTVGGR